MGRESDDLRYTLRYHKLSEDEKYYVGVDTASEADQAVLSIWMGDGINTTLEMRLDLKELGPHAEILYIEKIISMMKAAYVQGRAHARENVREALGIVDRSAFGSVAFR